MAENKRKFLYIYNLKQASFFIKNGLIVTDCGLGNKNQEVYFQFLNDEKLQEVFELWRENKK